MWNIYSSKGYRQLLENIIPKQIKKILYKGNKFLCPLCGFHARSLAPIGREVPVLKKKMVVGAGLRNAGCYSCGSTDRERMIFLYLKNHLHVFESNKMRSILHIAPEKNLSSKLFNYGFENYICGDLFTSKYRYPSYVQRLNILNIPFKEDSFDLIICNHVLEHIYEEERAFSEIKRVLKSEGIAIIQVPISLNSNKTIEDNRIKKPKEREKLFGQFDHVRLYGQDYPDRLRKFGFKVEEINIQPLYPTNGINENEVLYVLHKT